MSPDEWRDLPHLLAEYCDRCGGWRERICAFDRPNGVRSWYCRSCWVRATKEAKP